MMYRMLFWNKLRTILSDHYFQVRWASSATDYNDILVLSAHLSIYVQETRHRILLGNDPEPR
jgi:hypothetical protein